MAADIHDRRLLARYDEMWQGAVGKIRAGQVNCDPILAAQAPDLRRGLTLVARPSPAVRRRVTAFIKRLRALEPDQHYYHPTELHVTFLSLFTATVDHQRLLRQTRQFSAAVKSALEKSAAPVRIEFSGITASPEAILIQGFVEDNTLDDIRDSLRRELRRCGLAGSVDGRYRLVTAHMTIARFRAPLRNGKKMAAFLQRARKLPFGRTDVKAVTLVKNDWYMSRKTLEIVGKYQL